MNRVIILKDDTIHVVQSEEDMLNIVEEYLGFDFKELIEEIKEDSKLTR